MDESVDPHEPEDSERSCDAVDAARGVPGSGPDDVPGSAPGKTPGSTPGDSPGDLPGNVQDGTRHALVERVVGGDQEAVGELLEHHLPALRGFVSVRMAHALRAKDSVSDVVQSVCREVLTHVDRFQHPGPEAFRQWLYATTRRKLLNRLEYYRAQKRELERELPDGEGREAALDAFYGQFATPSRELVSREEIERIESALDALPEEYRRVLLLTRFVGLSRAEAAREMGKREDQVRGLLRRALARLGGLLAEGSQPPGDEGRSDGDPSRDDRSASDASSSER